MLSGLVVLPPRHYKKSLIKKLHLMQRQKGLCIINYFSTFQKTRRALLQVWAIFLTSILTAKPVCSTHYFVACNLAP